MLAQGLAVDRQTVKWTVRDLLAEPSPTYLPDTTLDRFVNYAQHETMLALAEKTSTVLDTIITSGGRLRYFLANTAATSDSIMYSKVAAVIYKEVTASGGEEHALAYVPPDILGRIGSGESPSHYSVVGRDLLLGKSPNGGDTLFVHMVRVPRDLSSASTALSVAKEDQIAVALLAASWAVARDKQYQLAQLYYTMWQNHIALKGYPQQPQGGGGQ